MSLPLLRSARSLRRAAALQAGRAQQVRHFNLHEYQSKELMSQYGVATQKFKVVDDTASAADIARSLGVEEIVVKAQIHAGGRGKGTFDSGLQGGVHLTRDVDEVRRLCERMLGHKLTTKQTTGDGVLVRKVMVAEALNIARETYFAIILDRNHNGPVMVASCEGGVDIEEVAAKTPDKIFQEAIDIAKGIQPEQTERLAKALGFTGVRIAEAQKQMTNLYKLFDAIDATQVEINPLGETDTGRVVCFDAKINFDDNAEFRQKDIFAMRDLAEEDPREVDASRFGLNFVGMDGSIGCMVNGAGLAMATMDIIKLHGGEPANFLDLGGGVKEESVGEALRILTQDKKVKAIFVNIFGGIVDCALVAKGLIKACERQHISIPITIRLKGTNEEIAQKLVRESGLNLTMELDMDQAARHAVRSASA